MQLELGVWRIDGLSTQGDAAGIGLENRLEDILERIVSGLARLCPSERFARCSTDASAVNLRARDR
jgi:hypothetical protein